MVSIAEDGMALVSQPPQALFVLVRAHGRAVLSIFAVIAG